jgi:hypothetical protein
MTKNKSETMQCNLAKQPISKHQRDGLLNFVWGSSCPSNHNLQRTNRISRFVMNCDFNILSKS